MALLLACSGAESEDGTGGDGDGDASSGVGGSGFPAGSGGSTPAAGGDGAVGAGGTAPGSGAEAASGGASASAGGQTAGTGGGASTGGAAATGGVTATGGSSATGGSPNTGQEVTLTFEENETGFCNLDGVVETEHMGFSGAGYANASNSAGQGMEWSLLADGGSVALTWRYACASARPGALLVNDVEVEVVALPGTTEWTNWQEASATVTLAEGENLIRLEADGADGLPNIDNMTATGMGLAAAACPPRPPVEEPDDTLIGFATLNGGTNGGAEGQTVTATNLSELQSYAESSTPQVIMIEGTIEGGSGGAQIDVGSNKSLIGVGTGAFLSGVGLNISSENDIVIQNLRISLVGVTTPTSINDGDAISIQGTSRNIWIDHCELFSEDPDVQTSIDKYDGLIDIKGQTGFITISWNYLHDHHKGGLVGAADDDLYADRKITYHHNYYEKVRLRVPMYRGAVGHFFNNYIVGAQDATEIRAGTCLRVEKNYYESLNHSIYTPSDSPGSAERIDNIEVDHSSRAYPSSCTADIPYDYSSALTESTGDVPTVVPAFAGVGL